MGSAEIIRISQAVVERLLEEARRAGLVECCGLLAGCGDVSTKIFPTTNELSSPVAYEIPPRELFAIFKQIRAEGLQLLGIYHSHPTGDNAPSERDIERAYYPDAAYFIISLTAPPERQVRAFRIEQGKVREVEVAVEKRET